MRRVSIAAVALISALLFPVLVNAQEATPPADPHVYDDPGMHFVAPAGAVLLGNREDHPTIATLSQDLTPVAQWIVGRPPNVKFIVLEMETYAGSLDGFDSLFENSLRGDNSATLVKHRDVTKLANGMPAYFIEVTQGSGFDTQKLFAYLWIDGQRGVVLGVSCGLGVIDADGAKQLLASATGVRYPTGSP